MTVASNASKIQYNCDGVTKAFAFTFNAAASSEVLVILTDANDTETVLTETTDYVVSETNNDFTNGGTVTTDSAYAAGNTITIMRNVGVTQESSFYEGQPTLYGTFEEALDHLARILQQFEEKFDRTPMLPRSTPILSLPLPNPEASKLLGWNATATGLENSSQTVTASGSTLTKYLSNYSSLDAAITAIGGAESELIVDTGASLTQNTTTPATMEVRVVRGGGFALNGFNLTVSGAFNAGNFTVFSGAGTVTLGNCPVYNVMWRGAVGDASTDDAAAINAAATDCDSADSGYREQTLWFPNCLGYACTVGVTIPPNINVRMDAPIISSIAAGDALLVGSATSYNEFVNLRLWVKKSSASDWTDGTVGIRLPAIQNSRVEIVEVKDFQYGVCISPDGLSSGGDGFAYNDVYLGSIYGCMVGVYITTGLTYGWVNENNFYGGAFWVPSGRNVTISRNAIVITCARTGAAYLNNHNHFYKPCFEIAVGGGLSAGVTCIPIKVEHGSANMFEDVRMENSGTIVMTQENGSHSNEVSIGYGTGTVKYIGATYEDAALQERAYPYRTETLIYRSPDIPSCMGYYDSTNDYIHIPQMHMASSSNDEAQPALPKIAGSYELAYPEYIQLGTFNGIGVFVDTRVHKRFTVKRSAEPGPAITSGTITAGQQYVIETYISDDDFRNVGADENASGIIFTATGTTPTHWSHSSVLRNIGYGGRLAIRCYDSTGTILTDGGAGHPYVKSRSGYPFTFSGASFGGTYQTQVDNVLDGLISIHPDVKTIAILIIGGTNPARIRDFSITSLDGGNPRVWSGVNAGVYHHMDQELPIRYATEMPTKGCFLYGQGRLTWSAATAENLPVGWKCTSRVDTAVTTAAAATDVIIYVDSVVGLTAGDYVTMLMDNDIYHNSSIVAVNADNIEIADGIPASRSVAETTPVYTMRHAKIQSSYESQGDVTPLATTAPMVITYMTRGIVTITHAVGANQDYQLPTGTNCDLGTVCDIDEAFDWSIINLSAGAANTATLTVNTDHTVSGSMVVAAGSSARFRTRKTATNTFVTYRLS